MNSPPTTPSRASEGPRERSAEGRSPDDPVSSAGAAHPLATLIPVGVFTCDASGRINFFNRRAAELWGREPALNSEAERYCGSLRCWRLDGTLLTRPETPMARALERRQRFRDQELIIERPDGTRLACSVSVVPQLSPEGAILGGIAVIQDITERKRSEELLGRQADLLSQTHDAIFAWRWNGTIVYWNRGAERLYGFSAAEALGKKTYELLKSEAPRDFDLLRYRLSRDGQYTEELTQSARDGRRIVVESRLVLSRSFDAQPVVLETNRDVTERREFELALRDSEERLRLAIDAGRIGTWDWDVRHGLITWSKHLHDIHGLTEGEFDGTLQSFLLRIHPEDRERVDGAIQETLRTGRPYSAEMRIMRPTGEVRWIFTNGQLMRDRAGQAVRMLGATVDITERKRAEEELRAREAEFRLLAESVPLIVWINAKDGTTEYMNSRWQDLTGRAPDEALGNGWISSVHPDDVPRIHTAWTAATTAGLLYELEYRLRRKDGEYVWHIARATPVRSSDGSITKWFGTSTDIDAQKRAEEQLERAVKERTAKLRETVGELEAFSYSVSHDLRAPLRAMYGYSVALMEDTGNRLTTEEREYLARISRGAQRLDNLINDVLTYSRLTRTEVKAVKVELDRVMKEIIYQYPALQPGKVDLRVCSPLGCVLGHDAMVVQAISNLLINAVKFVAPGVLPVVKVWSERRDEWVRLWVEDNGIGISAHNIGRIFGMFQRLNPASAYEGTGIGLSIVKKAVERMGGRVGVESDEGMGSRFWIELKAV